MCMGKSSPCAIYFATPPRGFDDGCQDSNQGVYKVTYDPFID